MEAIYRDSIEELRSAMKRLLSYYEAEGCTREQALDSLYDDLLREGRELGVEFE